MGSEVRRRGRRPPALTLFLSDQGGCSWLSLLKGRPPSPASSPAPFMFYPPQHNISTSPADLEVPFRSCSLETYTGCMTRGCRASVVPRCLFVPFNTPQPADEKDPARHSNDCNQAMHTVSRHSSSGFSHALEPLPCHAPHSLVFLADCSFTQSFCHASLPAFSLHIGVG